MSTPDKGWSVEAKCPHGYKALLRFDSLGYLTQPHPDVCREHENANRAVNALLPPPLALSERQIRREAKRAAKAAARKGWRPPWLTS